MALLGFTLPSELRPPVWIAIGIVFLGICVYASRTQTSPILGPCITRGRTGQPGVALTFDDGPSPSGTAPVLDLLAERGVAATFFLIGRRAASHPDLVRRIHDEGHLIGNHSHRHAGWLPFAPAPLLAGDMVRCQDTLAAITAERPRYYRPPYGLRNHATAAAARRTGLVVVGWDCGGLDTTNRPVAQLTRRILGALQPGSIVLLHDRAADPARTLAILRGVLDELPRRGLTPVRLDALLQGP